MIYGFDLELKKLWNILTQFLEIRSMIFGYLVPPPRAMQLSLCCSHKYDEPDGWVTSFNLRPYHNRHLDLTLAHICQGKQIISYVVFFHFENIKPIQRHLAHQCMQCFADLLVGT